MPIITGMNTRVIINGVDISNMVRSAKIEAEVDSLVTTTLELVAAPQISMTDDDHYEVRFESRPPGQRSGIGPVMVDGQPTRQIILRADS